MRHPNTLRACAIAGALVFSSAAGVLAQSFQINGRVKVDGGSLDGTKVVIYKDGQKQRTVNSGLSKFQLELDLNANYILSFEKEGFVTKKLSFDTHAPGEAMANGFTPFEFAVSMFKQYDDVNMVVFDQPVGMIKYSAEVDDFDYDTDYTKSIQSALAEVLAKVEQKQKEEADSAARDAKEKERIEKERLKNEAEAAKQKADADKARAKADADKAKADAEAAKLKSRQDAEAAQAAKREEEARLAAERKAQKETEAAKQAPKPKPPAPEKKPDPPKPPVVAKAPPTPPPKPTPKPPVISGLKQKPNAGAEARRSDAPKGSTEPSRVERAKPNEGAEAKPAPAANKPKVKRNEELIVEPNQVITRIALDDGSERREYRKVVHKHGAVHYFKDGQSCSKLTYDLEALAETR